MALRSGGLACGHGRRRAFWVRMSRSVAVNPNCAASATLSTQLTVSSTGATSALRHDHLGLGHKRPAMTSMNSETESRTSRVSFSLGRDRRRLMHPALDQASQLSGRQAGQGRRFGQGHWLLPTRDQLQYVGAQDLTLLQIAAQTSHTDQPLDHDLGRAKCPRRR